MGERSLGPTFHRPKFLTLALAALILVASCGDQAPDVGDLNSLPVAGLHPPDAQFVSHNEHEAEQTIDGPVAAIVGDVFATSADADSVFDYYEARLPELGYANDRASLYQIKTTLEEEVRVWTDGDVAVRLAIYSENEPQLPPLPSGMADGTLFELALIAIPPDRNGASP